MCPWGTPCASVDPDCSLSCDPDTEPLCCEDILNGTQASCDEDEAGCWAGAFTNPSTSPVAQCCGDDGNLDTWSLNDNSGCGCVNGVWTCDPDDAYVLCEAVMGNSYCDASLFEQSYCWDLNTSSCCGDDPSETWTYASNEKIDDLLVLGTCYDGKWYDFTMGNVTYYKIIA